MALLTSREPCVLDTRFCREPRRLRMSKAGYVRVYMYVCACIGTHAETVFLPLFLSFSLLMSSTGDRLRDEDEDLFAPATAFPKRAPRDVTWRWLVK